MDFEVVAEADANMIEISVDKYRPIKNQLSTMKQGEVLVVSPDKDVGAVRLMQRLTTSLWQDATTKSVYSVRCTHDGKVAICRKKPKQKAEERNAR